MISTKPTRQLSKRDVLRAGFTLALCQLMLSACSGRDAPMDHGPDWNNTAVSPPFVAKQNQTSTAFDGWVGPQTSFVLGASEGFSLTRPNVKVTVQAAAVWAYAPIYIALYDGAEELIGSDETRIAGWEISQPPLDGSINFTESQNLGGRTPLWLVVDFPDFAGTCLIEVLGYD